LLDLLIGIFGQGLIYAPMVLGVYITYKLLDFPDLSVEGTFPLGAVVTAVCLLAGVPPLPAILISMVAGAAAGYITGALHVYLKITNLLCGILTMTALYSINLMIMGKANMPLFKTENIFPSASDISEKLANLNITVTQETLNTITILVMALISLGVVILIKILLDLYMKTFAGKSLLAVGVNEQLVKTLAVNTGRLKITGLMIANALASLSGSLMAQYQQFADMAMGPGTVVIGLAAVIIGRAMFGKVKFIQGSTSVILGSIIYKLGIGVALKLGLPANNMKLMTAVFFVLVIILQKEKWRKKLMSMVRGDGKKHA
jgi:putative ABC transport system permease protein